MVLVSCSDTQPLGETGKDVSGASRRIEVLPLDTWTEVATDSPAVVEAVKWAGGAPGTVTKARVKVTSNLEYFETTRLDKGVAITEKTARHRWKVVKVPDEPGELGIIAPNHDTSQYQLLGRNIVRTPGGLDSKGQ